MMYILYVRREQAPNGVAQRAQKMLRARAYVCLRGWGEQVRKLLYTLYFIHSYVVGGSRYVKGVKDGVKTWEVRHPTLCECIKYKDG